MYYPEFLNGARKHVDATSTLVKELDELQSKGIRPAYKSKFRSLTISLFYLTGYIIECSVKYGIYCLYEHDKKADVKSFKSGSYTYKQHIETHRFRTYVDIFNKKKGGLVLLEDKSGIEKEVLHLFSNWDSIVRYYGKEIPHQFLHSDNYTWVRKFNEYAVRVFNEIKQIR